jgi:hypothetical protein
MWFSKRNIEKAALDEAPFIFPYFFDLKSISLTWHGIKLAQEVVEDPKLKMWSYCYFKGNAQILGYVNFWTYFKQFTKTSFCCFRRDDQESFLTHISLFKTEDLIPLQDPKSAALEMKRQNLPFVFSGERSEITVSMKLELGINEFSFPAEYKEIDELAFFATKQDLYPDRPNETYWADWVLVILWPREDKIEIVSLDWFNKSGDDFGYVWPTRVARSKKDGRLYGQGIRMANFVLDSSGKQKVG